MSLGSEDPGGHGYGDKEDSTHGGEDPQPILGGCHGLGWTELANSELESRGAHEAGPRRDVCTCSSRGDGRDRPLDLGLGCIHKRGATSCAEACVRFQLCAAYSAKEHDFFVPFNRDLRWLAWVCLALGSLQYTLALARHAPQLDRSAVGQTVRVLWPNVLVHAKVRPVGLVMPMSA